jgi:hypothetical protein
MKINITGDYINLLDKLKQIDNTYYITEEDALRVHISNNKPDNHVHVWQKVHDNKVTDPYSYYEKLKQDMGLLILVVKNVFYNSRLGTMHLIFHYDGIASCQNDQELDYILAEMIAELQYNE